MTAQTAWAVVASIVVATASVAVAADPPATTVPSRDLSEYILTPKPAAEPRIHGPKVYGQRPGRPFLYTIPATGDRPMTFKADNLPDGLKLDGKTGRMTGQIDKAGDYTVTLRASNAKGSAERPLKIEIGDT